MVASIQDTLAERETTHGSFIKTAGYAQALKAVFRGSPSWCRLSPDMQESLDMQASKIARILSGDPRFHDTWHDIAGYAQLVAKRLEPEI